MGNMNIYLKKRNKMNKVYEKATFAAGCFWGVQELFNHLDGIIHTKVGYIGGIVENPDYKIG